MSTPSSITMQVAGRTDVGLIREHNEDNLVIVSLDDGAPQPLEGPRKLMVARRGALLIVCDGMGGAAAGEVASAMAIELVPAYVLSRALDVAAEPAPATEAAGAPVEANTPHVHLARGLRDAALAANMRIFEASRADEARSGMGTTLTGVGTVDGHLVMVQVGDSRAYVLRAGQLCQVTRDQSLVNQLVESGQITEEQARDFEHSNVILQALGVQEDVEVLISTVPLCRGDKVIVCTDGLTGVVTDEELAEVLGGSDDMNAVCETLIEMARQAGGPDNITVVAAHFDGDGLPEPKPSDKIKYERWPLDEPPERREESSANDAAPVDERRWSAPPRRAPDPARTFFSVMVLFALALSGMVIATQMRRQTGLVLCQVTAAAGLAIHVDGSDIGVRTRDGGTTLKLSPGHHRIGLRSGGLGGGEQDVDASAAKLCRARFENAP